MGCRVLTAGKRVSAGKKRLIGAAADVGKMPFIQSYKRSHLGTVLVASACTGVVLARKSHQLRKRGLDAELGNERSNECGDKEGDIEEPENGKRPHYDSLCLTILSLQLAHDDFTFP